MLIGLLIGIGAERGWWREELDGREKMDGRGIDGKENISGGRSRGKELVADSIDLASLLIPLLLAWLGYCVA